MIIIGITGAIGHGKTSLAQAFLRQVSPAKHVESSILIARVADQLNKQYPTTRPRAHDPSSINAWLANLPGIIKDITGFSDDIAPVRLATEPTITAETDFDKLHEYLEIIALNHSLITQLITPENKEAYRPILQWLGAYITKHVSPTLWYDNLIQQALDAKASGHKLFVIGGVRFPSDAQVIHQAGGYIIAIERPDRGQRDAADATEAFRSMVPVNATIINDSTLGSLDHAVQVLWQDLQQDNLQDRYQASQIEFDASKPLAVQGRDIL